MSVHVYTDELTFLPSSDACSSEYSLLNGACLSKISKKYLKSHFYKFYATALY